MTNFASRRATIEDVAVTAGVSVATVSRALRGLPNVAPSTRQRVVRSAQELNYRADPNASRLAAGRGGAVAIAVPVFNSWYFSEVVAGAEAVFAEAGYNVLISAIPTPERRSLFVNQTAYQGWADGVVMVELAMEEAERDIMLRAGVPTVTIGGHGSGFPGVVVDNVAIGRFAVSHLADLGHECIGLIAGEHGEALSFSVPDDRRRGFEQELRSRGMSIESSLQAVGNFSVEGGSEAMTSLLRAANPPSAVFAISDEMAFGAIGAARARGVRVPEDLSVMGVDDHEVAEAFGLTTICQEVDRHGPLAARLLLDALNGGVLVEPMAKVSTAVVERATTARPGPR